MKNKSNGLNERLARVTDTTLVVGVDIAKSTHYARFTDYRGMEVGKIIKFANARIGLERIVSEIERLCKTQKSGSSGKSDFAFDNVIIGMEPTGHYWKVAANYLTSMSFRIVGVNPYHTKRAKELDDNSQTKNDEKDALTIARLVKDGRYFEPYLPEGVYAELRILASTRLSVMKRSNAVKNIITAILDEYFPEINTVFKNPLTGKAARQVLRVCPFPKYITELGEDGIFEEIRKVVKRSVGMKKVQKLIDAAGSSIGVDNGLESAKIRLGMLLDELELYEKHIAEIEVLMEQELFETGYMEIMLGIKGIGIVTAASFLGEIGDPLRFENARQIANYAGYNLVEDSSGKSKSGTCISKRGRSRLRNLLYKMAFTMVGNNDEMKELHKYLTTRKINPLKKKQSLVVISKKIITVLFSLLKKKEFYNPERVFGVARRELMAA